MDDHTKEFQKAQVQAHEVEQRREQMQIARHREPRQYSREGMTPFQRVTTFGTLKHGDKVQSKTREDMELVSEELALRANDAQIIEEFMKSGDPGADGVRGALNSKQYNPLGMRPEKFHQLYTRASNLDRVGTAAYWYSTAIEAKDPERIAETKAQVLMLQVDPSLDDESRRVAEQFARYLPAYEDFIQFGEAPFHFDNGETMFRDDSGKVVVQLPDGQVMMKPAASEDPRGVGVVSRAVLQKYLCQNDPEEDKRVGKSLARFPNSSQMMRLITTGMSGLIEQNDRQRFQGINQEIVHQEELSGVRPRAPEPKKKGFFDRFSRS